MIVFACPRCGTRFDVEDPRAGEQHPCPGCGAPADPAPASGEDLPSGHETVSLAAGPAADSGPSGGEGGSVGSGEWSTFLAPAQAADEIGRLGRYRVLAVLGRGGMGIVFRAHDPHLERLVALKAMPPSLAATPSARERFFREARAAAALRHPHVVTIFQVGEERGTPFLAMELLEGESLETRLERESRLPVSEVLRIGRETAEGLAAAHDRGLIHRDVKPANLWLESPPHPQPLSPEAGERGVRSPRPLSPQAGERGVPLSPLSPPGEKRGVPLSPLSPGGERGIPLSPLSPRGRGVGGEGGYVKILDFGLARALGSDSNLTQSGVIIGTPAYMAPEQAAGEPMDHRCDLFSLGCVLYQMCTGQRAFWGRDVYATMMAVATREPPAPRELNPDLPEGLNRLILALLSKDPGGRPASAAEVAAALRVLEEDATALPVAGGRRRPSRPTAGRAWKSPRVRLGLAALVAVGLVALTAGIFFHPFGREGPARDGGIEAELFRWEAGAPLSPAALVQRPAPVPGLAAWTLLPRGPEGGVHGIAYRPDGRQFAATDAQGMVRIWDADTGQLLRILGNPADRAGHRIAWSPDGRYLATGPDRSIKVWEAATGRLLRTLRGHTGEVRCLAWSPDGKTLASTADGQERVIRLWDPARGEERGVLDGHEGMVREVSWSPDGATLASASEDSTVRLWEVDAGTSRPLRVPGGKPRGLAWSPGSKEFATAGEDRTVRVWDAATAKPLRTLSGHTGRVDCVAWLPDGQTLISAGLDGALWVWKRAPGEPSRTIAAHGGAIRTMAPSPDGKKILCGSEDGSIQEWDTATGVVRLHVPAGTPAAPAWVRLTWSPDGSKFACHGEDGNVGVWQADSARRLLVLPGTTPTPAVAWSADGRRLAVASGSPHVGVWDTANGQLLHKLEGHTAGVLFVAWSPDGKLLASASRDRTIRLWEGDSGKPVRTLEDHKGAVTALAWSADSKRLASCSGDGTVRLWQADADRPARVIETKAGEVWTVAWSPDGKRVAAGGNDRAVRVWDVDSGEPVREWTDQASSVRGLSWSGDGLLACAGSEGGVRVWEASTGKLLFSPQGDAEAREGVSWSPDGKTLAAGGTLGTLHFWDAQGRRRATLRTLPQGPSLAVSPEGDFRASPGGEHRWVVVALTDAGAFESFSPGDFELSHGWKNDPAKVQPLGRAAGPIAAPDPYGIKPGEGFGPLALVRRPQAVPGVRAWSIETRGARSGIGSLAAVHSPDGARLATGHADGSLRLWEAATGRPLRVLLGHAGGVTTLSWSADGKTLATGSEDRTVLTWDVSTGRLRHTLRGHGSALVAVALSPDGRTLCSAGAGPDSTVRLWDVESGDPLNPLAGSHSPVAALAWSADSRLVAGACLDGVVRLWDPGTGELVRSLQGHAGAVRGVAWAPDGKSLVSGGEDGNLRFWDPSLGVQTRAEGLSGPVTGLAWSADGLQVAAAHGPRGEVQVREAATGAVRQTLAAGPGPVGGLAWAPDGKRLAVRGNDGALRQFEIGRPEPLRAIGPPAIPTRVPSPDGTRLARRGDAGGLVLEGSPVHFPAWDARCACWGRPLAWSPDGKRVATAFGGEAPRVWDGENGKEVARLGEDVGPEAVVWSPDGSALATTGSTKGLRLWDPRTGTLLYTLREGADPGSFAWSPDGKVIVAVEGGNKVGLYNAEAGKRMAEINLPIKGAGRCSTWSPDGKMVAGGSDKEAIEGPKTTGGFILTDDLGMARGGYLKGALTGMGALAWSPDSKLLLGGLDDGTVRVWEVPGREADAYPLAEWQAHQGPARAVAWAGRQVISGGEGLLRVWEADNGSPVFTVLWPAGKQAVAVSSQGHYRGAAGSEEELVYVVLTDSGEQENLSPAEFASKYGWTNDPGKVGAVPK